MAAQQLDLVFLWHMHQPDYRSGGEFAMPWTLLHALKDYTDMAGHFERHPAVRGVVNFVPVLLDQIEDYVVQFETAHFCDPLLRWLAQDNLDSLSSPERRLLLDTCFRSNADKMLGAFPAYTRLKELHDSLARDGEVALGYLSGAYLADLLTWYLLAWTGETERRREPLLAELMAKGEGFTRADRSALLDYIGRTLAALVPRYRALQERGQIELSTTPASHPLAPLLLDFRSARESLPAAPLPHAACYPGGRERVRRHLHRALDSHARRFGRPPVGLWPAEGALSSDFVEEAARAGCRWLASGENVLRHSQPDASADAPYRPWQHCGSTLFFRDDLLSDQIGFEYARWHGRDAAAHFVGRLEDIAAAAPDGAIPLVSVILDGENAWEYYPYNGYYFFEDLYGLLDSHPFIRTRTFAQALDAVPPAPTLSKLVAGSWVHGTFSTWIGEPAKNHAWELLCAAKQSYDQVFASGRLSPARQAEAESRLAVCESSDWFWWFGDLNPGQAVSAFDALFRRNLADLYRALDLPPPSLLDQPISAGRDDGVAVAAGGTMRRGSESLQSS